MCLTPRSNLFLMTILLSLAAPAVACEKDAKASNPAENTATKAAPADEAEEGFVPLFDGKTLEGWQGATKSYMAVDGVLVCKKGGVLYTKKQFADFIYRFEFKLEPGGNNGVALRWPGKGNAAYTGMECQILDDDAPRYKNLHNWQRHGSLYGLVPSKTGHLKPTGQWNSEEIVCNGTKVKVTLNGAVILDTDLTTLTDKALDGHDHPGRLNKKGYLGFLGHGHRMEFRNIRIKEL